MLKLSRIFFILVFFSLLSLYSAKANSQGPYLGQEPPGLEAKRFPSGEFLANSDWFWHGPLSFSPDGMEIYMTKYLKGDLMQINHSQAGNGGWISLQPISFAFSTGENNPFIFVDGSKLFYISSRPGSHFWAVDRAEKGWSEPRALAVPSPSGGGYGWQMSVAGDMSIYFDYMVNNQFAVFVSRFVNGSYLPPQRLPGEVNSEGAFCPFVNPNEDYIIFCTRGSDSLGEFDLYISFRNQDGSWKKKKNMGVKINSTKSEIAPYVTIDGRYLFFFARREGDLGYNPYWIDAQIIEDLKQP